MTNHTKGIGGHTLPNKGRTNDWLTPPYIIEALGPFDLDPCCPPNMPWRTATEMICPPDDGLKVNWAGKRIWLNPPYGDDVDRWMLHMTEGYFGTALIFARTETDCWFDNIWHKATAIHFFDGRLHFHYPEAMGRDHCKSSRDHAWKPRPENEKTFWCPKCGKAKANAGGPSALIAYGEADAARLAESGLPGKFIQL